MRRMLILCAVLLASCAKSEPPAAESPMTESAPATISLADVAGTWDGTITAADNDTALTTVEMTATQDTTGWTMKVANAKNPKIMTVVSPLHVVVDGENVIIDTEPFNSVLRPGQKVVSHGVYRLEDSKLVGNLTATYPASGESIMLRSVSTRRAN